MNIEEAKLELIEKYITHSLTPAEMDEVKQKLETDQDFVREVKWMESFHAAMQNPSGFHMLEQFQAINKRRKRIDRIVKIGLAVLVLIMLLSLIFRPGFLTGGSSDPDTSIERPDGPVVQNSPSADDWEELIEYRNGLQLLGETEDDQLQQALSLLERGQRLQALPLLESYLSSLPPEDQDYEVELEAGKIYLSERDFAQASAKFDRVRQSDTLPLYRSEARFYLALTELARGDKQRARALLTEISENEPEPWKSKAVMLLIEGF